MAPAAHLDGDARSCGAVTEVIGQTTVKVDGKLWAVEGDTCDHENGQLIASGSSIFIEGKKVIVNTPDHASADDNCPGLGGEHCDPKTAAGSTSIVSGY